MGKKSRAKRERRSAPPPVGKQRLPRWSSARRLPLLVGILALAAVGAGLALAFGRSGSVAVKLGPAVSNQAGLAGLQSGPPPWPAEHARLGARLDALGLPRLETEGDVLHLHEHLDLYVNGRPVMVPALIGINEQQRYLDPLHTHNASGIIHIESPTKTVYTLGQFLAVWGVRLTPNCIGGLCAGNGKRLDAYVNGKCGR